MKTIINNGTECRTLFLGTKNWKYGNRITFLLGAYLFYLYSKLTYAQEILINSSKKKIIYMQFV